MPIVQLTFKMSTFGVDGGLILTVGVLLAGELKPRRHIGDMRLTDVCQTSRREQNKAVYQRRKSVGELRSVRRNESAVQLLRTIAGADRLH